MNKRKWLLFLGIGIFAAALWWLNKQHLQLAPKDVKNWVLQFGMLAPFVFLFLSLFRPFVLVPITVFSLAAGLAFGSVLGTIYALIGATAGATGSFMIASTFRAKKKETESNSRKLKAVTSRIQEHGFLYILLLRIAPIHFDFVSYAAAASRANYRAFVTATFLGLIPGTIALNVLGSSFVSGNYAALVVVCLIYLIFISVPLILKRKMPDLF
ncbi:membrane protein [Bacillus safensis]|uniref:TVP38/TMEM64 family protein n=1 Tax=Bacillus TaxID=1386 RepID=UPI000B434C89|nr:MULTISPECIES: TVP38/TMEM64 family protein [Bacillus]MBG9825338.1 membrane protein [Bacillus safensis]MBG9834986.1 membrane protein [Bacillus safensis]MBG9861113.1 membrane protein [Bacillus safensis]MBG9899261.1 membrane protein [Bacillus safensis]MCP9284328.1 TVP38/TMEM64 family protein [Bacillus safensis]